MAEINTEIKASIYLEDIVNKAIYKLPENQRSVYNKRRFTEFAIDACRELRLMVTKDGKKWVRVAPDGNNRIDFPSDMEEFISLNVPYNGKLWPLTRINEIIPTKTVVGIDESLDSSAGEGVDLPTSQADSFTAVGGVNAYGYYTLDYYTKEIIVNATIHDELILMYVSSGISGSTLTPIPAKYAAAIVSFILLADVEHDRSVQEYIVRRYQAIYEREKRKIKLIEMPSLQEWLDAWNNKSSVR
jgi:hypothetical protein